MWNFTTAPHKTIQMHMERLRIGEHDIYIHSKLIVGISPKLG